jgi:hypothetical protein
VAARNLRLVLGTLWLAVPALLCVLALFVNLGRDSHWLQRPERVVVMEQRLSELRRDLYGSGPVGLWSDGAIVEAHFLAQYALAPRLVGIEPDSAPELLVAVTAPDRPGPGAPYRLLRDYGAGVRLYVREPR